MSWIDKILPSGVRKQEGAKRSSVPEGLWKKCVKCDAVLYRPDVERNDDVCPKCDHHMRIGARRRLDVFLDEQGREEILAEIEPVDRLKFKDKKRYRDRLVAAQKSTGEKDALVAMRGTLHGLPVVGLAFEFNFHGGSMGYAVGEKFTRAAQLALKEQIPLVCFSASGGARMQEALISLMQMAKTSAVIERMKMASVPYISVMTDPIYGGVSASLALLGDVNIAEPDARAGFAGPNIIEQTIRQKLPKGFQRSEFLLEHGAIDMIVHRTEMRNTIARLLAKFGNLPLELEEQEEIVPVAEEAPGEMVEDSIQAEEVAESDIPAEELAASAEELPEQGDGHPEVPEEPTPQGSAEEPLQEPEDQTVSGRKAPPEGDG